MRIASIRLRAPVLVIALDRLGADVALRDVQGPVDTLLVPGGQGRLAAADSPELTSEVRRIAGNTRRVCSVCGGAAVLAAAGLLDGRRATTHWADSQELAARHPDVRVEPDLIYVQDGNVFTAAGGAAGMDLALALVESDHGPELARQVARYMVLFLQRSGCQSQFSERLARPVAADSPLRPLLDGIVADPRADHRVPRLAERAGLSDRHLTRLFIEQTGTTPARYVERVRVEAARDLLERGSMSVEVVAARSGFGGSETMRRAFLRVLGVGPGDYRDRFRRTAQALAVMGDRLADAG
ncbi:MAG TPA: helix-turn-helix domain-containing protein [Pseudonocardiaceae bacterium]|nr:helix-turn-helix domain-containing protein [Pseudonocardiaceae bacterium]